MSESEPGVWDALSGYLRQVGRGFVYLLLLQYSVGIAVRMVLDRAIGTTLVPRVGVFSTVVVAVVAAILVNRANPPRYRRVTAFTLVSLALGFTANALFGVGDGHVGAFYPTIQVVLFWIGAFLVAYAASFEVEWRRLVRTGEKTDAG